MNAFLLISALVGVTIIVTSGAAFMWLQRLYPPLFRCPQCVGFWVGVAAGATGIVSTGHGRILDAMIVGAATSVWSLLTEGVLTSLLGEPKALDEPKAEPKPEEVKE